MNKKFLCLVKLVIGLAFVVGASATALGEEFYKGKTILFIVGFPPGGGYDTYTRAAARHIGKYIPGNPTPIVQNNGREPNKAEEEQQKTEEKNVVRELQKRDREVRAHEQAHAAALGPYKKGGPKYQFERGPDGRQYAVGGSVPVDLSPEKTPEETRRKAQTIRRAALAPKDPSGTDFQVAAKAAQMGATARAEISKERKSDKTEPASSSPNEIEDSSKQDEGPRPVSETGQISQIDVSTIIGGGLTVFASKLGTLTYSTSGQQTLPPVEPGQDIDFIV